MQWRLEVALGLLTPSPLFLAPLLPSPGSPTHFTPHVEGLPGTRRTVVGVVQAVLRGAPSPKSKEGDVELKWNEIVA